MTPHDLVLTPMGLRFQGRVLACSVGRGGIVPAHAKREGDGATPAGMHRIVGMMYRPDRMAKPAPWAVPIGPTDLWSDDPRDQDYNHLVRAPYASSHERLRRADALYDLVLITDWNWPVARPGAGSAIFLHRWRRPGYPTAGCLAFSAQDLLRIAQGLRPQSRLIIPERVLCRTANARPSQV